MVTGKNTGKIIIFFFIAFLAFSSKNYAQLRGVNYQAVAIDENGQEVPGVDISGQPLSNNTIAVRFSILSGGATGSVLYQETQTTSTDLHGLFSVVIGDGTVSSAGTYALMINIPWAAANQFLKVEIDIHNNGNFKIVSIQQFMAVPYAFYALNSGSGSSGNGLSSLVKTSLEPSGTNCSSGGFKTEYGLDANANGILDASEINASWTQYVCNGTNGTVGLTGASGTNGAAGASGQTSLVKTTVEPIGANCANGGFKTEYGLDANTNGALDVSEINSALTQYVCNGANGTIGSTGAAGTNGAVGASGQTSLVKTTVEPAGANCTNGGFKTEYGLDANANGILDVSEINGVLTQYVCNGINGAAGINGVDGKTSLVQTTSEPAGANCTNGGFKTEYGLDANTNGILDAGEINNFLTQYVCNGAAGLNGNNGFNTVVETISEPAGANCPTGGIKMQGGLDVNGNNVLDAGEINPLLTQYVCNGSSSGQNTLVNTTTEAAGVNCTTGGVKVEYGLDVNANGILDAGEVNSSLTKYVCNGAIGAAGTAGTNGAAGINGSNGQNTVVKTTIEPVGVNCSVGGVKLEYGLDANSNGGLDAGEINNALTQYVCNGANGSNGAAGSNGQNTLVSSTPEPVGVNCSNGGIKVQYGLDANSNGTLDAGEINSLLTQYVCNGSATATTQSLTISSYTLTISSGNSVVLPTQNLSVSGNTLSISNGNSVILPTYTAGTGISITSGSIINTAPNQTVTLNGTGATTISGTYPTYTINTPAATTYSAGTGISISSGSVINTAPDKTVTISGAGTATVTGAYPTFTVSTPVATTQSLSISSNTLSISGANSVTLPTSPDAQTLSIASNTLSISNGNSITLPVQTIITASTNINVAGTAPNYTLSSPSQTLSVASNTLSISGGNSITLPTSPDAQTLSIASNTLSILNGNSVTLPTYTAGTGISITSGTIINTAPNQTVSIAGTGAATVSGSYPTFTVNAPAATSYTAGTGISITSGTIINTAPNQTVSIAGTGAATVSGTYPTFTVNTPAATSYTAGTGISITSGSIINTAPNQTVSIAGTGAAIVSGTYPTFTVNAPAATTQSLSISSNTLSISGANSVTLPAQTVITASTNIIIAGSAPNYTLSSPSQTMSISGNTLTISGGNAVTLPISPDAQTLSISSNTLSISGGNSIILPSSSGWGLTGNAGTVDGTNFIGTTDNIPFNIRVNNQKSGRIEPSKENTFYGYQSGNSNSTGQQNTAIGNNALSVNTTSSGNTAIGDNALATNTGGRNTAVGLASLFFNSTGVENTALGIRSLMNSTTGDQNTAGGTYALYSSTTGSDNVAFGFSSLYNNIGGNTNTAVGYSSLYNNTSGNGNASFGNYALNNNVTGSSNTALGINADVASGALINATAIGANAKVRTNNSLVLGDTTNVNVGIGTGAPTKKLDVRGAVRIVDGTQGAGKILTSDASGNASWQAAAGGSGWGLTGNAGTVDGTNFIGTTDAVPFNIRVANLKAGRIDPSLNNTFYGLQSGNSISTGGYNTATGYKALYTGTTNGWNSAYGAYALTSNTTGNDNTAIGYGAMYQNITGSWNVASGYQSLFNNTAGNSNVANGNLTLNGNTTGNNNSANGSLALSNNISGNNNTANGYASLDQNTLGNSNTANGNRALFNNTSGNYNTADGDSSLLTNTTGNNNTALGYNADVTSGALTNATAIGANAKVKTSNSLVLGDTTNVNVGVGTGSPTQKLHVKGTVRIVDGTQGAGKILTSDVSGNASWQAAAGGNGWSLTGNAGTVDGTNFIGTTDNVPFNIRMNNLQAGRIESSSVGFSANTYFGYRAGIFGVSGQGNVAIGNRALSGGASGGVNVAIGEDALLSNGGGQGNTAIGQASLVNNLFGQSNTAVGQSALSVNVGGFNNTSIGSSADVSVNNLNNATAIGNLATVNASNKIRLGNTSVTVIEGQVAYSFPSDGRFKNVLSNEVKGLDFITKLRPITYTFDTRKFDEFLMQNMPESIKTKRLESMNYEESSKIIHTGFIAQEVEQAAKESGFVFDGVNAPKNENENYSVAYSQFVVPLVKAIQEQQKIIEDQKATNDKLQKQVSDMQKQIDLINEQLKK
jgi:hypothetical protein